MRRCGRRRSGWLAGRVAPPVVDAVERALRGLASSRAVVVGVAARVRWRRAGVAHHQHAAPTTACRAVGVVAAPVAHGDRHRRRRGRQRDAVARAEQRRAEKASVSANPPDVDRRGIAWRPDVGGAHGCVEGDRRIRGRRHGDHRHRGRGLWRACDAGDGQGTHEQEERTRRRRWGGGRLHATTIRHERVASAESATEGKAERR